MSDTTVADVSSPQTSTPTEVEINQNPVNIPNPVGSQAPAKAEAEPDSAERRREAIRKAFERADKPQQAREKTPQRAPVAAAEAKAGHNQPPEETPKLDLKKRPDDQPQAQPRDRGRFTRRPENSGDNGDNAGVQAPAQPQAPYRTLPAHVPHATPPARISEAGKRDWADTPESVRGDMHRMTQEFAKAYTYYRDDAKAFQPLKHYHQMAQQQGTTLDRAVANFVNMEAKLRADPIAGLDVIVNNLGLTDDGTPNGNPIGLRDIAYHILSSTPDQLRQMQIGNQQQAAGYQLGALHQEIQGLKSYLQQMHTQQRFTQTRSQVDEFANEHPRFDELGDLIESELKLGFSLDQAYQRAELLRPAAHAPQTRTAPAQTRPPDRSIYGSPDVAVSNTASRKPREASRSPRSAVENAIRRVNGGY